MQLLLSLIKKRPPTLEKMADVSALEHIVEKPVFQNSINYDDTIRNCNLLDIINVSGELEVIPEGNEGSSNVANRYAPEINNTGFL